MKYLGIDYGSKHVGIAISDKNGSFAFPHATIPNNAKLIDVIEKLAQTEQIDTIVIGNTRSLSGEANDVTAALEKHIDMLESRGLTVERIWEGWSSHEAARFAPKGKTHDNSAAAAVILQRFLDMHGNSVQ